MESLLDKVLGIVSQFLKILEQHFTDDDLYDLIFRFLSIASNQTPET